jgi:hypothetical protein
LLLRRVVVEAFCDAKQVNVAEPMVGCGQCGRQSPVVSNQ